MKKIILLLLFSIFLLNFQPQASALAVDEHQYFGKVQTTGVQFCSAPSESSALFEIPATYFVQVEYVVDDYYKVNYDGANGYVKKNKVALMNGTPSTPFAQMTYNLFVPYVLYQTPYSSSEAIAQLTSDMQIKYYGSKEGEQLSQNSKTWFYSSVEIGGERYFGYVFSQVAYQNPAQKISTNNESFEIVSEDILLPTTTTFTSMSTGTKVLLIVAISVPSLLILYFLIKPSKIMQITKTKKKAKRANKVHHGDYFEFDENEL